MLAPGDSLTVTIEKPAAGGRMIARVDGQVVLVDGAIPGERVSVRIERVGRGVAYAATTSVEESSPDRQDAAADRLCGGCLYAHIAYPRQLELKSLVIADAFGRIGHARLPNAVSIAPSPAQGYRMRARLHRRGSRLGFFREGTHDLCDPRATSQLLAASCDVLDRIGSALAGLPAEVVREIDLSENLDASQRVIHVEASGGAAFSDAALSDLHGVSGVIVSGSAPGTVRALSGSPYVSDALELDAANTLTIRRHVLAFFQGNRFLLRELAAHVATQVVPGSAMIDLYAGGGLFAAAAARSRGARVTAVEGDWAAAADLTANVVNIAGVTAVHTSVERFVRSAPASADAVLVDPPRTGMSREALDGVVLLRARRVVYVSCDVATLARDARRLIDAGYEITRIDGFDLFPNTPHVEAVTVFEK
jgi:23S rRNA (uracil1939-C5)-methyltransferase